jgi:endonuclease YncB( thermonuclease family)
MADPADAPQAQRLYTETFADLPVFSFAGMIVKARVVDVHDGDTITIVFFFRGLPIKHHLRMLGYDSPEMRPALATPDRDLHKAAAECAKRHLASLVLNKVVLVSFCREEKFGRLMGNVYLDSHHPLTAAGSSLGGEAECANAAMVSRGYGKRYDGKKKKEGFSRPELEAIIAKPQ